MQRIYLTGPRACGKTTVGAALAEACQAVFLDTDQVFCTRTGGSIAEFVARESWDRFRDEEHQTLRQVIGETAGEGTAVISTGGGIVLREENRRLLHATGLCLYLQVPVPELVHRLAADPKVAQRPSLTGAGLQEEVADVVRSREPLYQACAHACLDGTQSPSLLCEIVLKLLKSHKDSD